MTDSHVPVGYTEHGVSFDEQFFPWPVVIRAIRIAKPSTESLRDLVEKVGQLPECSSGAIQGRELNQSYSEACRTIELIAGSGDLPASVFFELIEACEMVRRIPGGIDPRVRLACEQAVEKACGKSASSPHPSTVAAAE